MALSTYTELVATVIRWLHRSDMEAQVPDFITLLEAEVNRRLRVRQMVTVSLATISDPYSAVPDDFAEERSMILTAPYSSEIVFTNQAHIDQMFALDDTEGQPAFVAVVGEEFRYYPTPDQDYTATLSYFANLPALGDDTATNWLLDKFPDAYLYGACAQAAPYMLEDNRIPVWQGKFEQIMAQLEDKYTERGTRKLRADAGLTGRAVFDITRG